MAELFSFTSEQNKKTCPPSVIMILDNLHIFSMIVWCHSVEFKNLNSEAAYNLIVLLSRCEMTACKDLPFNTFMLSHIIENGNIS